MSSKFKAILDAAREPEPEDRPEQPIAAEEDRSATKRLGRPAVGKKSDPAYQQVTAYVRRDLYRDVRIALLQDRARLDFSELVDQLLERWQQERLAGENPPS